MMNKLTSTWCIALVLTLQRNVTVKEHWRSSQCHRRSWGRGVEGGNIPPEDTQNTFFFYKKLRQIYFFPRTLIGRFTVAIPGSGMPPIGIGVPSLRQIPGYADGQCRCECWVFVVTGLSVCNDKPWRKQSLRDDEYAAVWIKRPAGGAWTGQEERHQGSASCQLTVRKAAARKTTISPFCTEEFTAKSILVWFSS